MYYFEIQLCLFRGKRTGSERIKIYCACKAHLSAVKYTAVNVLNLMYII
jgi:hypothetical protein